MGARYILAWLGNMAPPSLSHRSRATITESNIDSRRRKYPIHSEMITSTFGVRGRGSRVEGFGLRALGFGLSGFGFWV
jgi:hypothetical protein